MNFDFTVENEKIKATTEVVLYSGNINTYTFTFSFNESWDKLAKLAVFNKDGKIFTVCIENNSLTVPSEILENTGMLLLGVYATNGSDDLKRMSSERIKIMVSKGAYSEGESPAKPTPDIYEQLVGLSEETRQIAQGVREDADSGAFSYVLTSFDKEEIADIVKNEYLNDIEASVDDVIDLQNQLMGEDDEGDMEVPSTPETEEKPPQLAEPADPNDPNLPDFSH